MVGLHTVTKSEIGNVRLTVLPLNKSAVPAMVFGNKSNQQRKQRITAPAACSLVFSSLSPPRYGQIVSYPLPPFPTRSAALSRA